MVLDTNALLMPFQFSINLDSELDRLLGESRMVVPRPVIGELKRSGSKFSRSALALARKYEVVDTEEIGDEAITEVALRLSAHVVTNDRELISELKEKGVKTISLRSGTYLDWSR